MAPRYKLVFPSLLIVHLPLACIGIRQAAPTGHVARAPGASQLQEAEAGGAALPRRLLTVVLAAAASPALAAAAERAPQGSVADGADPPIQVHTGHSPHPLPVVGHVAGSSEQEWQLETLPLNAPKVPYEELDDEAKEMLELRRGQWPFDWMWSRDLFLRFEGSKSLVSGLYRLETLNLWSPKWRRVGGGKEALLEYVYKPNTWEWFYKVQLVEHSGAHGDEVTSIECGNPGLDGRSQGDVSLEAPAWTRELMVTRSRVGEEADPVAFEMHPGVWREGMPVYRSVDDEDGDQWIVSQDGVWLYGLAPAGSSLPELIDTGFFEQRGAHAASWTRTSVPHGGSGPEAVMWHPVADGSEDLRIVVSDAAPSAPSSGLELSSKAPSARKLVVESSFTCLMA